MIAIQKKQVSVADNNNPNDFLIKVTIKPTDDKSKWQFLYITQEELQNLVEVLKVFNHAYNKLK